MAMRALRARGLVVIEIEKRLPVQGGLGGASSNAVAALLGLERVLKKSLPGVQRLRIAAEVGSDLPLFLVGGTVLGVGRGEQVYPLPDLPAMACVVVTPEVGVSTPKAFAEWDRRMTESPQGLKPSLSRDVDAALKGRSSTVAPAQTESAGAGLRPGGQPGAAVPTRTLTGENARLHTREANRNTDKLTLPGASDRMIGLGRALSAWLSEPYSGAPRSGRGRAENPLLELVRAGIANDFEEVVFPEYPELREGKLALERAGAQYASLSGSGSALYGLFSSRQTAARAAATLRRQGWEVQKTVTLTRRSYGKKIFD
jgi:4-diphosphocytidyl-2-C-methyl-D-erythritol kinase